MAEKRTNLVLIIVSGPQTGEIYQMRDQSRLVVGRENSADLVVSDPMMSRRHFEILRKDSHWLLRDLGSLNGTTIDSQQISDCVINSNAHISAGLTKFRIDLEHPRPSIHTVEEHQTTEKQE